MNATGGNGMNAMRSAALFAALGGALLTCVRVAALEHSYDVSLSDGLDRVSVTVRLGSNVDRLTARNGRTRSLAGLESCDGAALRTARHAVRVPDGVSCLRYRYPLDAAPAAGREPEISGDIRATSPSRWLWLPALGTSDRVLVRLFLPDGAHVSTPWPRLDDGRFLVAASPESSTASVLFGKVELADVDLPGARLRVALVDTPVARLDRGRTLAWLRAGAMDVAGVYGRFPNPSPQVIVIPVEARLDRSDRMTGSPVPFGHVIRDQGEAVRFFVNPDQSLDRYLGDWTATHEFAHLLLPYVEQKWVSEGFASYYQNVLLARRRVYSETEAWQRLTRSFSSAAAIADPPSPNGTLRRPFWSVRMLVYWSGAAVALMADVELRRVSGNRESLDTVLGRLGTCCLPSTRTWTARELFEQLDQLSEHVVFVPLYERIADTPGMPDLDQIYRQLGIVHPGRDARLTQAPDSRVRQAIMGVREDPALVAGRDRSVAPRARPPL